MSPYAATRFFSIIFQIASSSQLRFDRKAPLSQKKGFGGGHMGEQKPQSNTARQSNKLDMGENQTDNP